MIYLVKALNSWGSASFEATLKQEISQLDIGLLPLQEGLSQSSLVTDSPRQVMVRQVSADEQAIHVSAGIFYSGIIAGCNCADDPTPISEQNEYCEVHISINRQTALTKIQLSEMSTGL